MKHRIAMVIVAAVVLGGAAFAWAEAGPSRPSVASDSSGDLASLATLADSSTPTAQNPGQNRAALRQALQQCRQQAGIPEPQAGGPKTPPTAAQRQQVLDCLAKAGFNLQKPGMGHRRGAAAGGFLGRTIHGDLIIRDSNGTFKNVVFDRGTEDGLSGNTLTITRPDNAKVSVELTSTTKYVGVQNQSQLQPGRMTVVVADTSGKALLVAQPNRTRPAGPSGRVTS